MSVLDLSDLGRKGGSITMAGVPEPAQLVAGCDLILNGEVLINGQAIAGEWKRGEIIQTAGHRQSLEVSAGASYQSCLSGFMCLTTAYSGSLGEGETPPGSGNLGCAGAVDSGPIGKLLHFAFIDESSTYFGDEALRQEDIGAYAAAMADVPNRYVVLFQLGPTFAGGPFGAVLPGPDEVVYERIFTRPASTRALQSQFNQGVTALSLGDGQDWWMSFSIDNSGSMSDADVRDAVDFIIGRANQIPGARVAETYGSGTERWIQDIVIATEEIREEIAGQNA